MSIIALIPARSGSKGIPGKNFKMLGDRTLVGWAAKAAREAGIEARWVSSDIEFADYGDGFVRHILRPAELASDTSAMIDVVRHALEQIPGRPDDIWVLLQPTQPFREPKHIQQAIALLRETQADSVVSVVELPKTHHPDRQLQIYQGRLEPYYQDDGWGGGKYSRLSHQPASRQECKPTYIRDGTCYVFKRSTVMEHGDIYGVDVRPLVIPASESCSLDTESDWADVERRWKERHEASTR